MIWKYIVVALVLGLACTYIGFGIGRSKGLGRLGGALGLLLGLAGIIIIASVPHPTFGRPSHGF